MGETHFWEVAWIANPDEILRLSFEKDWANVDRRSMPMPSSQDAASIEYFHLGQGIDGFRTQLAFGREERPPLLPVGELRGSLSEPMLWLTCLTDGSAMLEDPRGSRELVLDRHAICFRHTNRFHERMKYDTRAPVCQVDLTIRDSALLALLGEDERDELLRGLELSAGQSPVARPMPTSIIDLMRMLLPDNLTGRVRILHSQGKALELLGALLEHCRSAPFASPDDEGDRLLSRLHDELLQCDGCVPVLDELAAKYGQPARQLNEAFKQRYGMTIYAFMINRRLDLAFEDVSQGRKPLKVIAAELGYGHVNNFLSAFKRRHGTSPGRLRKGPADGGRDDSQGTGHEAAGKD